MSPKEEGRNAEDETPLSGGFVTETVKVGDTIRRAVGPWSPAVHALLEHLESAGYDAAPRYLGMDERGREVLSFVEGVVPDGAHPEVVTDLALRDVGGLVRSLHRAVGGFKLPPGRRWHFASLGGPEPHVVCHHDLSPKNTVFRDGRAVAFIDWEMATPEAPIHDVVHAAWQFVPLASDEACARQGWPRPPEQGRRLRLLLDAYGLPDGDREGFAFRVAERMETSASGIEALAAGGEPAFQNLTEGGVPGSIRRDRAFVEARGRVRSCDLVLIRPRLATVQGCILGSKVARTDYVARSAGWNSHGERAADFGGHVRRRGDGVMMSEKVGRTRVRFDSGGVELVGYLNHPSDTAGKLPCVVMGHGFSGTQDRLFDAAERFAGAGFAALTFDYRSFGESGGEPRQVVGVKRQLEDWRAAIRFARGLAEVDPERIALWGSSLGGGHVVSIAAEDPRIAAVVAQIPFNGFPRRVEDRSTLETLKLLWAMMVDAAHGRLGLPPRYVSMVGRPGEVAVTATPRANEHIAALEGERGGSSWRNEVAPRGLFGMMRYRPGEVAHRLSMPLLVSIAEDDREGPEELTRQLAERAPRGELRRYPGDHFDFYRDPVRRRVLADQIEFLRTHLAVARNHA